MKDVNSAEKFVDNSDAEEASPDKKIYSENLESKDVDSAENVEEVIADAEEAGKATEPDVFRKETTDKVGAIVKDVEDEICPDELYKHEMKEFKSIGTQTLECEVNPTKPSKRAIDYYTLNYEIREKR